MIVVSNTTPLIGLAVIQRFDLLRQFFGEITIPQAVYEEAVVAGHEAGGAKQEILAADWIKVVPAQDRLAVEILLDELDLGESETIVLAREIKADWVLMDERKGRRKLTQLNQQKIGTLGILLKARQSGLLSALKPELELLHKNGFNISQQIIEELLRQAGE
jgi:predicted nucleic acid-binding protein